MDNCIFCKIINKEIPKDYDLESENLVVFPDINPSADVHLLIVPKKHLSDIRQIEKEQADLLVEIFKTVNTLVEKNNLTDKLYRVVVNGGKAQHVPHLHFHLLGGHWKKMV